jgi:hypothetical protein
VELVVPAAAAEAVRRTAEIKARILLQETAPPEDFTAEVGVAELLQAQPGWELLEPLRLFV